MRNIWTVEINNVPTVAFMNEGPVVDADDDRDEAEAYLDHAAFIEDLTALTTSDGKPLWDGEAKLVIRGASEDEKVSFRRSYDSAKAEGEIDDEEDGYTVFLVPVSDPTDDA